MALLRGYVDDSGRIEDPAMICAGLIAPETSINALERSWRNILSARGLSDFHAREMPARLRGRPKAEHHEIWTSLASAIVDANPVLVGMALKSEDFRAACRVLPWLQNRVKGASGFCLEGTIQYSANVARSFFGGETLAIMIDRASDGFAARAAEVAGLYEKDPLTAETVVRISFGSRLESVALQCADMIAWEIRRAFAALIRGERPYQRESLRILLESSEKRNLVKFFDYEGLLLLGKQIARRERKPFPETE